jgi:hypothetical protein
VYLKCTIPSLSATHADRVHQWKWDGCHKITADRTKADAALDTKIKDSGGSIGLRAGYPQATSAKMTAEVRTASGKVIWRNSVNFVDELPYHDPLQDDVVDLYLERLEKDPALDAELGLLEDFEKNACAK